MDDFNTYHEDPPAPTDSEMNRTIFKRQWRAEQKTIFPKITAS